MVKLDLKDRKILFELDNNSRQPDTIIAKKIGLSKQAVGFRIKRMRENELLTSFYTIIDISKLGFTANKNYIRLQNVNKKIEEEMILYFKKNEDIIWAASCDGKFDIIVSFWAKNMVYLTKVLLDFQKQFGEYILERQLTTIIHGEYFIRDYLVDVKPSDFRESFFEANTNQVDVDKIDWKILYELGRNSRIRSTDIAKKINLSSDAVSDRIKRLENKRIIKHYNIVPNESKYPYLHYKVLVGFKNISEEKEMVLKEYCRINSNIVYIVKCLGQWDFELDIEVENTTQFRKILMDFKTKFSDIIKDYSVLTIYKVHKYNFCPSIH